jgi:hypothetical protein
VQPPPEEELELVKWLSNRDADVRNVSFINTQFNKTTDEIDWETHHKKLQVKFVVEHQFNLIQIEQQQLKEKRAKRTAYVLSLPLEDSFIGYQPCPYFEEEASSEDDETLSKFFAIIPYAFPLLAFM